MNTKILALGDLHLFAKRSRGEEEWFKLSATLGQSDAPKHCVLLGDIFDFAWARHDVPDNVVGEAGDRLAELVQRFPNVKFEYVLGNHDACLNFIAILNELADGVDNLNIHLAHVQIGDILFLHGDIADKADLVPDTLMAHRAPWAESEVRSKWREILYGIAVLLRIDQMGGLLMFFPPIVEKRLSLYVSNCALSGVRHIVYGHTHRSVKSKRSGAYIMSNAGAPIGYRKFKPLVIDVEIDT